MLHFKNECNRNKKHRRPLRTKKKKHAGRRGGRVEDEVLVQTR